MKPSGYTDDCNPKAYNLYQLAFLYNVSASTMRKWLKKIDMLRKKGDSYIYTPADVQKIFDKLGCP